MSSHIGSSQVKLALLFLLVLFAFSSGVTIADAGNLLTESGLQRTIMESREASTVDEYTGLWVFGKTPYELENEKAVQMMSFRGIMSGFLYEENGDIKLYTAEHNIKPQTVEREICNRSLQQSGSTPKETTVIDVRGIGVVNLNQTDTEKIGADVLSIDIEDSRVDREDYKVHSQTSHPIKGETVNVTGHPDEEEQVKASGMEIIKNCENYLLVESDELEESTGYSLSGMSGSPVLAERIADPDNSTGIAGVVSSLSQDVLFLSKLE